MKTLLLVLVAIGSAAAATPSTDQAAYLAMRCGGFFHYNMTTFVPGSNSQGVGHVVPNIDPDNFAPTVSAAQLQTNMEGWMQMLSGAGCGYAALTTKHHDGFALWPTAFHVANYAPYSIAQTKWYAANGSPDLVKMFVTACAKYGIKPVFYFSIWDRTLEARDPACSPSVGAACFTDYLPMIEQELTELLSNYGPVTAIWTDGWGWAGFYGHTNIPFATIYPFIKSLQPHALLIENDHAKQACDPSKTCGAANSSWDGTHVGSSDIAEYEISAGDVFPGGNTQPSEGCEPIAWGDTYWFYNGAASCSGLPGTGYQASCIKSPRSIYITRQTYNSNAGNYLLDTTPDGNALIPAAEVAAFTGVSSENYYPTNLAAGATVTASSQYPTTGAPGVATDGVLLSNGASTMLSTNTGDSAPTFTVDLGSNQAIGRVEIFNRTDVANGQGRLRDLTITITNAASAVVYTSGTINANNNGWGAYVGYGATYEAGPGQLTAVIPTTTGRYVKVLRTPTGTGTDDADDLVVMECMVFAPLGLFPLPSALSH